jgi:hypothetical protein
VVVVVPPQSQAVRNTSVIKRTMIIRAFRFIGILPLSQFDIEFDPTAIVVEHDIDIDGTCSFEA